MTRLICSRFHTELNRLTKSRRYLFDCQCGKKKRENWKASAWFDSLAHESGRLMTNDQLQKVIILFILKSLSPNFSTSILKLKNKNKRKRNFHGGWDTILHSQNEMRIDVIYWKVTLFLVTKIPFFNFHENETDRVIVKDGIHLNSVVNKPIGGFPVFSSPQKPTYSNLILILNDKRRNTLQLWVDGYTTMKSLFSYLFIFIRSSLE